MTENGDDTRAPLSLEEVAQAVLDLCAERTLEGFAARFLENLRRWAAPSAVLAAVRDPSAASGWRLLPALCAGSGPLGAERSVRQMIDDVPQDLARPSLVRPGNEVPGVRVRENCVVPWSCEGESGVLMLRGVVHPPPPNLADAVALLCAPVWPRLLGGPAARVEASVAELRRLADRLRDDADRQVERLQTARPPTVEAPLEEPLAAGRVADLEQQLTAARGEVARLLEERRAAVDAEAAARKGLAAARKEIAEAGSIVARNIREREELRQQVATLEKALEEVEGQRDLIRGEADRFADLEQQLTAARGDVARLREERRAAVDAATVARESLAAARKEIAEAGSIVARNIGEREELRQQVTALEKALGEVEGQRNLIRGEADRLADLEQQLTAARGEVARLLEERRAAVYAEAEARRASRRPGRRSPRPAASWRGTSASARSSGSRSRRSRRPWGTSKTNAT